MEPAAAARGGSLVRVRVIALAYNSARGPRRVVGAGLAAPSRRRVLIASLQEPLGPLSLPQEGDVALAPEADEEVHGDVVTSDEISSPPDVLGKTVRVRFVLNEQRAFGQSFHLVGNDPALGLWDPSNAVALDWSEGHDWTVEKDLPANRLIEFKFLLQDSSRKFHWQNGPNRNLQTGDTANTLVVYEDWGDVKNQKMAEDGDVSVRMEDVIVPGDSESRKSVVSADELQLDDDNQEVIEDESTVGTNASVQGESVKAHEANQPEIDIDGDEGSVSVVCNAGKPLLDVMSGTYTINSVVQVSAGTDDSQQLDQLKNDIESEAGMVAVGNAQIVTEEKQSAYNEQDELKTLIRISQHNKPMKSNLAKVVPQDDLEMLKYKDNESKDNIPEDIQELIRRVRI